MMLKTKRPIGAIFLLLSFVPLGFLIYTLLNLQILQISIIHPRVIVEFSLFVLTALVDIWLRCHK
jgi:hypothetical protein